MTSSIDEARNLVASEIGPDIANFTDPDEKRFVGEALMIVVAGAFIHGFLVGFGKSLGKKLGEKAGDSLGVFISEKIDAARKLDKTEQRLLIEEQNQELKGVISNSTINANDLNQAADQAEKELILVLSRDAPEDTSERIGHFVRETAVRMITG